MWAAWDAVAAISSAATLERLTLLLAPARAAGRDGRAPLDSERRRLLVVSALTLGLIGWMLGGPLPAAGLTVVAPAAVLALVRARRRRWHAAVELAAAPAARAIADALSAGSSIPGAIDRAARDGAVGDAGRALLRDARTSHELGEPLAAGLARVAARSGGAWRAIVAAILLQRETGGDLAGLLRGLANELDAARRAEGRARAASAQARLTARIVLALPLIAVALAELAAPHTIEQMLADPRARLMITLAALLQAAALVCVRRITARLVAGRLAGHAP